MCYNMLCKYQKYDGDCTIYEKLCTDEMPQDAECQKEHEEDE